MPRHLRALDKTLIDSINASKDLYRIGIDSRTLGRFYQLALRIVKFDLLVIVDVKDLDITVLADYRTVSVSKGSYCYE